MPTLGFLHTAHVHVDTFDGLVHDVDPDLATVVVVDESLLADARVHGPMDAGVVAGIGDALDRLESLGATLITCTCSTISAVAEEVGRDRRVPVLRVDRPMAIEAVQCGPRIAVVAAVDSTFAPTRQLLEAVAAELGASVEVTNVMSDGAWARFEAGDAEGYLSVVGATCADLDGACDVIVLAQASMAPVVDRVQLGVPILASPRLAVAEAVARLRH